MLCDTQVLLFKTDWVWYMLRYTDSRVISIFDDKKNNNI